MVAFALFSWIPLILLLFWVLPPRRAMIVAFLFAWLFLPVAGYAIPGLPDYTKVSATNVGILLAAVVFDSGRLLAFRPRLLDLPMLTWCLCPFVSSISNQLGVYEGLSAVVDYIVTWGLPYLLGRIYLTDLRALRELALSVLVAGLVYAPLCLWEIRMSPNLSHSVYGVGGAGIEYLGDLGKWGSRPRVFMGTALTVGLFMTSASLMGIWLHTTGSVRRLGNLPTKPLVALLVLITIGCKNLAALTLLVLGVAALFAIRRCRTLMPAYLLILAGPLYMASRGIAGWTATPLVNAASAIHERRAESLQFRLTNEDLLMEKALARPVFGWGRWGRARVYGEDGKDISATDGLWVIALGRTGLVG
ncbi:MAG: O-antigen ligase domain-containing protein, partial [Planctomycetota bacterium]